MSSRGTGREAGGSPCGAGGGEEAAGGGNLAVGGAGGRCLPDGGDRILPAGHIREKEGGVKRKTNLTLPSYVWVQGETAKWPNAGEGEAVAAFVCLFGMSDPPQKEKLLCPECASLMKHRVSTLGGKCGRSCTRGGDIHQVGGYEAPESVFDATALLVRSYAPKGGRPTKHTKRGAEVVVVELDAPHPPLRVRPPPPPPSRRRWPRWRPSPPPPPPLDVVALAATVATHVTDACHTLVEQAAVTGSRPPWQGGGWPSRGGPCRGPRRSRATLSVPWTRPSTWPTRGGRGCRR